MKGKGNAKKVKAFFKKNVYYIVMVVCILAIAAMITVAVVLGGEDATPAPTPTPTPGDVTDQNPPDDSDTTTPPGDDNTPVDTTPEPIVFAMPVEGGTVIKDYAMDTLVWSQTLKQYSVHPGIDFAGAEGANALAVYDGVVSSVTYDQLNGNVVKIDHGNGLVTIYSSLGEPAVTEGQTVSTGTVLGALSTSASKEMSDGAHLHFEVSLNGEVSNPYDYLPTGDK